MHSALGGLSFAPPPASLAQLPTAYSLCLGSINATAVFQGLVATAMAEPACLRAVAALSPVLADWTKGRPSPSDAKSHGDHGPTQHGKPHKSLPPDGSHPRDKWVPSELATVLAFTDAQAQAMCKALVDVVPCLEGALLPTLMTAVASETCCSPALAKVVDQFGSPAEVVLATLVRDAADVLCSTQSPGFDGQSSQTCAFAMAQSLLHAKVSLRRVAKSFLQLPTNQACSALVANVPFQLTNESELKAPMFTPPFVPSTCIKPLDTFVTWVSRWPWVQARWAPLFAPDDCLSSSSLWRARNNSKNTTKCLHIPQGFAETCSYTTTLNLFTGAMEAARTPEPTNASATPASVRQSSTAKLASSAALVCFFILLIFL
ncbi:hypothetical protein ACHHYP_14140 [Achlya hypogyna]|uniref:Uncharacterized protein n=1 Tax=Achlya hypogyna TaxID=1202772 RepID=A0A1V9YDY2_ACHHY|nr:hypothetical protein ACHHYP_14140 [Achlya hypogyna]